MSRPQYNFERCPGELKKYKRWLVWKFGPPKDTGKRPKLPYDLTDPDRTVDKLEAAKYSFDEVLSAFNADERWDGIGFFPTGDLIGVDFDDCVHDGTIKLEVEEILQVLGSYTELSPSENGLRVWIRGKAPKDPKDELGIRLHAVKRHAEVYPDSTASNYLTFTGWHLEGTPDDVRQVDSQVISKLYAYADRSKKEVERPKSAPDASKLTRLQRFTILSLGRWNELHSSQSDADFEFCCFLAEADNGNVDKVVADFKESALYRSPDQGKHAGYPRATAEKAISSWRASAPKRGRLSQAPASPLVVVDNNDYLARDIKPREVWVRTQGSKAPVITAQSLSQIFAWRGLGKTNVAMGLAGAMAKGEKFLAWECVRPVKVLYVEGEMPASQYQERLRNLVGPCEPGYFRHVSLDFQKDNVIPALATAEGRQLVEDALQGGEMLFLDSISTLARISSNEEDNWLEIIPWMMKLRSQNVSVMSLQHAGKTGLQRGHSRSEDPLDLSINLTRPEDYNPEDGLRCLLKFDKTRDYVRDGDNMEIRLTGAQWTYEFVGSMTQRQVEEILESDPDATARSIARELGVSHTLVNRYRRAYLEKSVRPTVGEQEDIQF